MIQVSNEFKKAIKNTERRIKGYVEVLYDVIDLSGTLLYVNIGPLTRTSVNDFSKKATKIRNLYGNLDYLPLDGSYITLDDGTSQINSGIISNNLFESIQDPNIRLEFPQEITLNGLTLYFRTNIPTSLTVEYSDETQETINNDKECLQIIFDEPKTLTSIQVNINDMEYQDRKIYLMDYDLGISQVYKNQDLIEFTVDEEVNKLVEEVPINETNIILNNMSNLFNPLNPTGIVPYLSQNTLIRPYIGVLTENLGIEYVKMGEFYFDSYTNNSDATTTLVGKNILNQVQNEPLRFETNSFFFQTSMLKEELKTFLRNYKYSFGILDWDRNTSTIYWKNNNLLQFLKDTAFYEDDMLYADRENKIWIKRIDNSVQESLTKNELINDAEYKKVDKINKINVVSEHMSTNQAGSSRTILNQTIRLKETQEIYAFTSSQPEFYSCTLSYSGGTSATIVGQGFYLIFIKIIGNVGDEVTITLTTTSNYSGYQKTLVLSDSSIEKENVIEFNSPINFYAGSPSGYINNTDILNRAPNYEMSFEYNGDPSLEAGDYISVETPYGYKKLFIQKNRFKFDGGLEGSIEGVE